MARAVVPDDRDATIATIGALLDDDGGEAPDLLVTTGGVSVGRHDHLRPALEACGVRELLYGVQIGPATPSGWGAAATARPRAAGQPGVGRRLLPRVRAPADRRADSWERRMPMAERYAKQTPRTELVRCAEADGALRPLPRQGSHAITSLAGASHLAVVEAERRTVAAGELVRTSRLV